MVPKPRINLLIYHGVFARGAARPPATWWWPGHAAAAPPPAGYVRPKYVAWAALLERTFAIDVLACPECGGRLRLIATINDSSVIDKILGHLGLPTEAPTPMPAKAAGWLPGVEP